MARIPTWTELRLDATELTEIQKECYTSVHHLLDHKLATLDKKISTLIDADQLEHLKPLPMPVGEYLKLNRPEMVEKADKRVSYLKKTRERRKFLASSRIINAFEKMQISSTRNGYSSDQSSTNDDPDYWLKYEFSEQEMKRRTARIYNRLPEVEKRRNEEVKNHMKVQNFKNRLEYGKQLLNNRRRGIINYPLKSSCDLESNDSSQCGYSSISGPVRAADTSLEVLDPCC